MIKKFRAELVEGDVYKFVYFSVISNEGKYRASSHQYKIVLNNRTKVSPIESATIPEFGFSLLNSANLIDTGGISDYMFGMHALYASIFFIIYLLVDFLPKLSWFHLVTNMMGLVTVVSNDRQINSGGNGSKMVELEMTDAKYVVTP